MLSTPDNRRRSLLTSIVFGGAPPQPVRDLALGNAPWPGA